MPLSGSAARRYAEALLALAPDERAVLEFRASLEKLSPVFDRVTVAGQWSFGLKEDPALEQGALDALERLMGQAP